MEVDLQLLRQVDKPALSVPSAGIAVPFLCGVALVFAAPKSLIPDMRRRLATALFLAVALSRGQQGRINRLNGRMRLMEAWKY
jgi:Kef-type K+ transport system membrane component KefB